MSEVTVHEEPPRQRGVAVIGAFAALALVLGACVDGPAEPRPDTAAPAVPPSVEERARGLAAALARHDWAAVAATAAPDGEVRVEVRQVLTETDERNAVTLRGRAAFQTWLEQLGPDLDAARNGARWPRGLRPVDSWQPYTACADARDRSVPEGTLALRRVCFSDPSTEPGSLSYMVLAEAK